MQAFKKHVEENSSEVEKVNANWKPFLISHQSMLPLPVSDDFFYQSLYLKRDCKLGKHFHIVDDATFNYFRDQYGAIDLPRLSTPDQEVEVYIRGFYAQSFPRVVYLQGINKP